MGGKMLAVLFVVGPIACSIAVAQTTPSTVTVLRGLAPVATLSTSNQGRAALAANYTVTGGLQTGELRQATLLPFPEQEEQALRDAFITGGNLAELSDGLGTTLGSAYLARAHYLDWTRFTSISPTVANLIAFAESKSGQHSAVAKFFFANATTDGKQPVSAEEKEILIDIGGQTDIFGIAYGKPAGSADADVYGNSRPFQTEQTVRSIMGPDYLNTLSDNWVYNHGPMMNLRNSPSYPSGHATYGFTGVLLLALLVPERYEQMVTRGAEYGNDRILVGSHYAMDVLGGRTLAMYDVAHLLANDPMYLDPPPANTQRVADFRAALKAAKDDVRTALESACGKSIADCAVEDTGRFSNASANEAFYANTQTYNLPTVYAQNSSVPEDVSKLAPEAGYLLTAAFPQITLAEADRILTETEGPGGGFLDNGSSFGVYSRLDLYAAAKRVRALPRTAGVAR